MGNSNQRKIEYKISSDYKPTEAGTSYVELKL